VAAFHIAYMVPALGLLMGVYLYALVRLTEARTARRAFYFGFGVGMACFGPQLWFFWDIFHVAAVALWAVGAIWIGFFVLIGWGLRRVPGIRGWFLALMLAVVWMGLEYFRSELYYLKFAWLTPGFAMGSNIFSRELVALLGVYGTGFVLTAVAALCSVFRIRITVIEWAIILALLGLLVLLLLPSLGYSGQALHAIAIQLESPSETQILDALDKADASDPHPNYYPPSLLVMSEYNLTTPPTPRIREWCRSHQRYLLIGGIQPLASLPDGREQFADTAFVVDPKGEIVFAQGKCVPIQFFDDGVPAKEQQVWNSPWGRIGICICYDLSYSRVTDKLIQQGANALIIIAMDAMSWGEYEHNLHARIAPARAAEYHVDILRVASSGVTQCAARYGNIQSLPFPDQGATMYAKLDTRTYPRLPPDRYLAPVCVGMTALIVLGLLVRHYWPRGKPA
jgi:apolipoprotein N-acyltransferase